jgi:hypothetical protein
MDNIINLILSIFSVGLIIGKQKKDPSWMNTSQFRDLQNSLNLNKVDHGLFQAYGLRPMRIGKVLSAISRLYPQWDTTVKELEKLISSDNGVNGEVSIMVSGLEAHLWEAVTKFRSCLSAYGCNQDTMESHINLNTLVVRVLSDKGEVIARTWLIWDGKLGWTPEPRWYGCSVPEEVDEMVLDWLRKTGLLAEERVIPIGFVGWLDSIRERIDLRERVERTQWVKLYTKQTVLRRGVNGEMEWVYEIPLKPTEDPAQCQWEKYQPGWDGRWEYDE